MEILQMHKSECTERLTKRKKTDMKIEHYNDVGQLKFNNAYHRKLMWVYINDKGTFKFHHTVVERRQQGFHISKHN